MQGLKVNNADDDDDDDDGILQKMTMSC